MSTAITVLLMMTAIGLIFGLILAIANKKFSMEINPLIHTVEDVLPKGQCGACGYAGCMAYAEAVVLDPNVSPSLCIPGKDEVAKVVARLTGKEAAEIEPKVAHVKCGGDTSKTKLKYNHNGVRDCVTANLLQGGPKSCRYGCIGFGTCINHCKFDALTLNENGLPVVNIDKCTGCGKCEEACPKKVITMRSKDVHVHVNCNSLDKGADARKFCNVSCIGCNICGKNCEYGAIKIENNLAVVNTEICIKMCSKPTCLDKCPTKAIQPKVASIK